VGNYLFPELYVYLGKKDENENLFSSDFKIPNPTEALLFGSPFSR
jgi:hypothetical protein